MIKHASQFRRGVRLQYPTREERERLTYTRRMRLRQET
jgi:hypothetical protein